MHVVLLIITCQQHLVCFSVLARCSANTGQYQQTAATAREWSLSNMIICNSLCLYIAWGSTAHISFHIANLAMNAAYFSLHVSDCRSLCLEPYTYQPQQVQLTASGCLLYAFKELETSQKHLFKANVNCILSVGVECVLTSKPTTLRGFLK